MKTVPFLSIPLTLAGCAGLRTQEAASGPYPVSVANDGTACRIVAGGRTIAPEELADVVRAAVPAGRSVLIQVDRERTSYRCIGGTIYNLQRAGVRDFAFDPPWPDFFQPE